MCSVEEQGIDLNRNYDWDFGGSGSSKNPCAEDFSGPSAFSEPETQAIKRLIETRKQELKLVHNLHTFGNLFLHPFSSDDSGNERLHKNYPEEAKIYEELWTEGGMPYKNM